MRQDRSPSRTTAAEFSFRPYGRLNVDRREKSSFPHNPSTPAISESARLCKSRPFRDGLAVVGRADMIETGSNTRW